MITQVFARIATGILLTVSYSTSMAADKLSAGVTVKTVSPTKALESMTKAYEESSVATMDGSGSAVVLGGAELRLVQSGNKHEIILPIPQQTSAQIPIDYALVIEPETAARRVRICQRGESNIVVRLNLKGESGDIIKLRWGATVLLTDQVIKASPEAMALYQKPSACVQSDAESIAALASSLKEISKDTASYASAIQKHVRGMEKRSQLKSMDAVGMLDSGNNWICTANANLAAALFRHLKIPARTIAVVPINGQRLEMHRTMEYIEDGRWLGFDPSSVYADIPLPSRKQIVMAVTSFADENVSMKPRIAVFPGSPYGHEIEMLSPGIALHGKDFFWTKAKPIAQFEVSEVALKTARKAWTTFLRTGEQE